MMVIYLFVCMFLMGMLAWTLGTGIDTDSAMGRFKATLLVVSVGIWLISAINSHV